MQSARDIGVDTKQNIMRDEEAVIPHSNEAFGIEVRGFDHIPEPERNMTLRQVDLFWVANSVNLFSFAIGALAIAQGLSLWMALAACVVCAAVLRLCPF